MPNVNDEPPPPSASHDSEEVPPDPVAPEGAQDEGYESAAEETITFSIELRDGLAAAEVERRALAAHRAGEVGSRVTAFYLADLADRGLHQLLGCSSLDQYARQRADMGSSTFHGDVGVGRRLQELPEIDRLFAAGEFNWTKVRALVRVATGDTERAWGEWASGRPLDEVEQMVQRRQKGQLPTDADRRRIHTTKIVVQARLNPVQEAVWSLARETLERDELEMPVSDDDLVMWIANRIVRADPEAPLTRRPLRIDLDPLNHGEEAPYELRDVPASASLRSEVLARDGYRCVCCGKKKNLAAHHMVSRRGRRRCSTTPWSAVAWSCR